MEPIGIGNEPAIRTMQTALRGLSLRQQVVADNIANVDTPGFQGSQVSFEDALTQAISGRETPTHLPLLLTNVRHIPGDSISQQAVQPAVSLIPDVSTRNDGNNVDVEAEMAKLAEAQLSYSALTQLLSIDLSILRSAASEGRR